MSQSPFARSLFISACVGGVVFSIAAAPFALFKSNTVGLTLQNRDVYSSELKYLAGPYLALAGGMSAAVGLGVFGLIGWRQSACKVARSESERQEMMRSLAVHQTELERIKFSEARLHSQNLNTFLQPELTPSPLAQASGFAEARALEQTPNAALEMHLPYSQPGLAVAPVIRPSTRHEEPQRIVQPVALESLKPVHEASAEPLENLLYQLHQLSKQVEELRGNGSNQLAA